MSDKILKDKDYIAHNGCWITCGPASIRIIPSPEGINIRVYKLGHEDESEIDAIWTPWSDLEQEITK